MTEQTKVAYVFPGQGSQWVGMGRDLYEQFDAAKIVFDEADDAVGFALSQLCFEGPEDELRQTINAQPAIVAASLACLRVVEELDDSQRLLPPTYVAGHSLGEYTALAAAGVLDIASAIYLASERGRLMHEAGLKQPGGMVAVIGADEALVAEACEETGTQIANINCSGQLVISGAKDKLAETVDLLKSRGVSRTIPLQVSGAFHTPLMQPAADGLAEVIKSLSFNQPLIPIIANTTAEPLTTAEAIEEELLRQLCNCVRWQQSVKYMISNGVSTFIEIGPGKVLTGLIKRIDRAANISNIGDAESARAAVSSSA
ncbi:MAG: ACP S-malonyltransferase [Chloroflexi bacterium]|nr:ACP S-malonyltransferase [Chloroflexota bacterium]